MTAKHPLYQVAGTMDLVRDHLNEALMEARAALGVLAATEDANIMLVKTAAETVVTLGNEVEVAMNIAARCRHWGDAITHGPPEHPAGPEGL